MGAQLFSIHKWLFDSEPIIGEAWPHWGEQFGGSRCNYAAVGEPPEFQPWRRKSDGNVSSGAASIKQDLLRQYCEKAKQWYQRELPGGGSAYRLVHLDTDDLFQELENG